jgi:hypothetical protein
MTIETGLRGFSTVSQKLNMAGATCIPLGVRGEIIRIIQKEISLTFPQLVGQLALDVDHVFEF